MALLPCILCLLTMMTLLLEFNEDIWLDFFETGTSLTLGVCARISHTLLTLTRVWVRICVVFMDMCLVCRLAREQCTLGYLVRFSAGVEHSGYRTACVSPDELCRQSGFSSAQSIINLRSQACPKIEAVH